MNFVLQRTLHQCALLVGSVVLAAGALRAEYSWQVSGAVQRLEVGDVLEGDGNSLDATYYFRPVDDQVGPYALAPFLDRSSRVTATVHREDQTQTRTFPSPFPFGSPITSVSTMETQGYAIAGRHVWRRSGWYAGGGYRGDDIDAPPNALSDSDVELEGYSVLAGKYLGRTTSLELAWNSATTTHEISNVSCIGGIFCPMPAGYEIESEDIGVNVMHVGDVGNLSYSLSGGAVVTRSDISLKPVVVQTSPRIPSIDYVGVVGVVVAEPVDAPSFGRSRIYSVAGELFPTARLGVRLGYSRWDGDPPQDDSYDLSDVVRQQ